MNDRKKERMTAMLLRVRTATVRHWAASDKSYRALRHLLEEDDYGDAHEAIIDAIYLLECACETLDELRMAVEKAESKLERKN